MPSQKRPLYALKAVLAATLLLTLGACQASSKGETEETEDEWIHLFDGTSTEGWRAYNGDALPPHWVIKDGTLTFDTEVKLEEEFAGGKDIIYAAEEFDNFELYLEWKIPEGGNSGVFYHTKEGFSSPYEVSPEYQLLDDLKWEEINNAKLEEWQKNSCRLCHVHPRCAGQDCKTSWRVEYHTHRVYPRTGRALAQWKNGAVFCALV